MKKFIKYISIVILYLSFNTHIFAQETIKIGLLVPLSGENKKIGEIISLFEKSNLTIKKAKLIKNSKQLSKTCCKWSVFGARSIFTRFK